MATQKQIKSRIQLKHDSKANWDKATTFVPLAGELIVYDDLKKIKVGDGSTTVGNLKFVGDNPYTSNLADTIYWYYNESTTKRRVLRFQSIDASFALYEENLDVDNSWYKADSLCTLSLLDQTWSGNTLTFQNSDDYYHQMILSRTGINFYDDDIGGTELSINGQNIILRDSNGPSITLNGRTGITFAGIGSGTITGITDSTGTSSTLAASQKLLNNTIAKYLPLSGGTLSGALSLDFANGNDPITITDEGITAPNFYGMLSGVLHGTVYFEDEIDGDNVEYTINSNGISVSSVNSYYSWSLNHGGLYLGSTGSTITGITDSTGTSSTLAASQKLVSSLAAPIATGVGTNSIVSKHLTTQAATGNYTKAIGFSDVAVSATIAGKTNDAIITEWNKGVKTAQDAGATIDPANTKTCFMLAKGLYATAEGVNTLALGDNAHAEGGYTIASGARAHSEGSNTVASGDRSHAEGGAYTSAEAKYTHAEGCNTHAYGWGSHTEGSETVTGLSTSINAAGAETGRAAHAEGDHTVASGNGSHAEGKATTAYKDYSHVEGQGSATDGNGIAGHAEGMYTVSRGHASHAENHYTKAFGDYSHAEGSNTRAEGQSAHAEGQETQATKMYAHAEGYQSIASGNGAHAEGYNTTASGQASHAEGADGKATGERSHAEGAGTTASGAASHAEGANTVASSDTAHAEGNSSQASGAYSHAEGLESAASGVVSHAEGDHTTATHLGAHVEGKRTFSGDDYQHVAGKFNKIVTGARVTGGGSGLGDASQKNIEVLDWNGNLTLAGGLYLGNSTTQLISGITDSTGDSSTLAASQQCVTKAVSQCVKLSGGTMTGNLVFSQFPSSAIVFFGSGMIRGVTSSIATTAADYVITCKGVQDALAKYQPKLTAGDGISITQNSSTGAVTISCSYAQYSGSATQLS